MEPVFVCRLLLFDAAKILYVILTNQTKSNEILYNIFYLTNKYYLCYVYIAKLHIKYYMYYFIIIYYKPCSLHPLHPCSLHPQAYCKPAPPRQVLGHGLQGGGQSRVC